MSKKPLEVIVTQFALEVEIPLVHQLVEIKHVLIFLLRSGVNPIDIPTELSKGFPKYIFQIGDRLDSYVLYVHENKN